MRSVSVISILIVNRLTILYQGDLMYASCNICKYNDIKCDFVWILKPWYHIVGISIMRCIKYDVTEDLGVHSLPLV